MSRDFVYLDFAATTPVDPRVAEAMRACLEPPGAFANPASIHIAGRESSAIVEKARRQVAELIGAEAVRALDELNQQLEALDERLEGLDAGHPGTALAAAVDSLSSRADTLRESLALKLVEVPVC